MREKAANNCSFHSTMMPERDFRRFSDFIYDHCGVNLQPAKRTMLTLRLLKRMRALGILSFGDYYEFVLSPEGRKKELIHMIDVVTTNKTDFFREPKHFDFLVNRALPNLLKKGSAEHKERIAIWSAGCSTGEEPYTLAMVLQDYLEKRKAGSFSILATDISTRVLEVARQGIYDEKLAEPVPNLLKNKYLMRGKGSQKGFCRIVPELRNRIRFDRLNLIEGENFGIRTSMDIIFCRNVVIYFDRETQIKLFEKFYNQLAPGGYMFIGHSETLHGINSHFVPEGVSIYRKKIDP